MYDAADNAKQSYDVAVSSLRERLEKSKVVIGDCTLYCEDCRFILPTLSRVAAVVTDPPYGINFAGQPTKWQRRAGQEAESWDDSIVEDLPEILAKGDTKVVWGGNYYALPPSRGWLAWYKPDAPPSMGNVEFAWTSLNQNSRQITYSIGQTNAERVGHPTQKPLAVMLWTLRQVGLPESILDPFMGSGTTLVAAVKLGKRAIGIEKDPKYFEIACRRVEQAYAQGDLFVSAPSAKPKQLDLEDSLSNAQ